MNAMLIQRLINSRLQFFSQTSFTYLACKVVFILFNISINICYLVGGIVRSGILKHETVYVWTF